MRYINKNSIELSYLAFAFIEFISNKAFSAFSVDLTDRNTEHTELLTFALLVYEVELDTLDAFAIFVLITVLYRRG